MRKILPTVFGLLLSIASATATLADITTARNFYQYSENVLTAGQPAQELLEGAADDGVQVVINVVPTTESIYNPNEAEILMKDGIEYHHVPVNWRSPKESELKAFFAAMDTVGDKKVLVHCWANARASALVYAYRVSKAPETKEAELANLKKVWTDVAGYNLDTNTTWQKFLDDSLKLSN